MDENNTEAKQMVAPVPDDEAAKMPSPARTEPRDRLDRSDLLEVQNIHIRLENLNLKRGTLQAQMSLLQVDEQQLQNELNNLKARISAEYGIDLNKVSVSQDGAFVPKQ